MVAETGRVSSRLNYQPQLNKEKIINEAEYLEDVDVTNTKQEVVYVRPQKPPTREFMTQTDQEMLLVFASNLFLSELNDAMTSLSQREDDLCGILNIQSLRDLDDLRQQAKSLIGRIQNKAFRGISMDGSTHYPPKLPSPEKLLK